jgi:hypothetical protein
MKVGIPFERIHEPRHRTASPVIDENCVQVEVALPKEIEVAVEEIQKIFGNQGRTPLAGVNDAGHGVDGGIILWDNLFESFILNYDRDSQRFEPWAISTRLSLGPTHSYWEKIARNENKRTWDANPTRYHISVWAQRIANPILKIEDNPGIEYRQEEVHFSMRWLDGKFDDWNDLKQWKKERNLNTLGKKGFDGERTTYMDISKRFDNLNGWKSTKPIANRIIATLGPRTPHLPENPLYEEFRSRNRDLSDEEIQKVLQPRIDGTIRAFGYSPLLEVLSQYGNVSPKDAKRIPKMAPQEGLVYLTNQVLPAVLEFARTR